LNPGDANPPGPLSRSKERWLVLAFCLIAAVRVFIYAAAFPFYNNVDEGSHLDMVLKYSRLPPSSDMEHYTQESVRILMLYASPEFGLTPDKFPGGKFPSPHWLHPSEPVRFHFEGSLSWWQVQINHEASSAPLYYILAGRWMRLGRWLGLQNLSVLYWIRFLNVPLSAALVWLGYIASKLVFPERSFTRLGVPLLLAFFPQDIYYGIQSDTLSPLCFGAAFVGLLRWLQSDAPSPSLGALTGLALAATFLVKITNLPLVGVALVALMIKSVCQLKAGTWRAAFLPLVLLLACAALPIAMWCFWSLHKFGDLTGSTAKIQRLGWTPKPFLDWWRHPIFSPSGALAFWSELMASFWRGEFVWLGRRLSMLAVDVFYWASSLILPCLAVASLFWKRTDTTAGQRRAFWLSLWSFAASVAFLGFASIYFNFGWCPYPSTDHPYFTSGRLLCGALIPFLLLYVHGLDKAFGPIKSGVARMLAMGGIVLLMTISEFFLNLPAFSSQYNWFHT
jgi:hypothetical protein